MKKILLSLLVLLASCQSDNSATGSGSGGNWVPDLRITSNDDPSSLDPRKVRDLSTVTVLHMLYEGLTRSREDGTLAPGVAQSWEVSDDLLTYTFKLREAFWSNGDRITAHDFENSWKSILDPEFPAPNAYQLFVIKGAKDAKEGKASLDDVGIHAQDIETLVVTLDSPTPYFVQLTSTHFYFPVSEEASNGPFKLHHWKRQNELGVEKNDLYWDAEKVKLNRIALYVVDEQTALQMFEKGDLDWVGSPMSTLPQDAIQTLKEQDRLLVAPAAGTHWFRFNTANYPFDDTAMRRAFALALNRQEIVDHITQGNQTPATGIVPPSFGLHEGAYFEDFNQEDAGHLFAEAMGETKRLPVVTLCYATSDRNHKVAQAVQQQWREAFGIEVRLENCESQVFYDRLKKRDYQIAIGSWYADIRDPINFLDVFKYRDNSTNNTEWENPVYTALLDLSLKQVNERKRQHFLQKAEALLIEEMPVLPLFHGAYNFMKKDDVANVRFSELGYLDFKEAERKAL